MQYRWLCVGCDTAEEQALAAAWEELQAGLDARLEMLGQPADDAAIVITQDSQDADDENPAWEVLATVTLPAKCVTAAAEGDDPKAALEQAIRRLLLRLDRFDQADGAAERPSQREAMEEVVPHLAEARRRANMQAFAALLYPVLRRLRRYAARELAVREIEGHLLEGEWDIDELVNETLLLAWENFEQRPAAVGLQAWLVGLFGQVLERAAQQQTDEVLLSGSELPVRRVPLDEEASEDQWVENFDDAEELSLSDLLPGERVLDVWEQLEPEKREVGLNRLLGRLTHEQRQALILAAEHGLEDGELADAMGVSVPAVQAMVTEARQVLSRSLNREEVWDELQDAMDRDFRDPRRRRT